MKVLKAIRTRRSIGKLAGEVDDDVLRTLVEAGLCAPNHKLTDPLHFIAVREKAREHLGHVWGEAAASQRDKVGDARDDVIAKESRKTMRAPLLLVVAVRTDEDPVRAEEDFATAAAATQNVLLAAHGLGYGAIWRTGDMVRSSEVREHLGLSATDRIVGIVYVGKCEGDTPRATEHDIDKHLTILT